MLNGKQIEDICTAIVDSYSLDDLRQLVRYELDQRLDAIVATDRPLNKVVFDLVDWADANDLLLPLLTAAAARRPKDPRLAQLAAAIAALQPAPAATERLRRIDLSQRLRAPAETHPEIETTLITWLIDRAQQTYELAKIIQRIQNVSAPRPVICLVHGNDDECHDKFVQRIVQYQLQLLIPSPSPGVPQHFLLDLPPRGYHLAADLHDFLRAGLGANALASMAATAADINSRFANLRAPVVIQTLVRVDGWSQSQRQTVYDYLCFWNDWPDLAAQQWLLVFVCLRAQPKTKGWLSLFSRKPQNTNLAAALAEFNTLDGVAAVHARLNRVICAPLPELEPISRDDAEGWASDPKVQQVFAGRDLVSEVGNIYAAQRLPAMPMATLHQMLVSALRLPMLDRRATPAW